MKMLSFGVKKNYDLDLMVIGGGSAAFATAIRAAEIGARVGIAEAGVIGGTCLNRGCLPTKNLLYAAARYHLYSKNSFPGLPHGSDPLNFPALIQQKDELVQEMRKQKYLDVLEAFPSIRYFPQRARFLSERRVRVGDEEISAEKFLIATGAAPVIPPIAGLEPSGYITYKESLELKKLPESMVVIGGGAIGLEIGQMYARFGTRVVILEALNRIAPGEEPEISDALKKYLSEEGIEIVNNAQVTRVEVGLGGEKRVSAEVDGASVKYCGEQLLVATGLRPNTEDIGLDKVGVKRTPQGSVIVNDELRTTAPHVWAAGDVTGRMMLVTVAAYEGALAAENAVLNRHDKMRYDAVPHAIFTSPGVASVGLKEEAARSLGKKVLTTVVPFGNVPKAGAIRDTRGLIKMVVDAKDYTILGVHILNDAAPDLIHLGVLAIQNKMTVGDIIRTVFVYPTLAEAFKIAAISFQKDVTKLSCCAA
ncbi:MAG: mercury(II) reductase [Acidobacteriota bacterium]|nr:mercury(II) reductase [Acidobacteriota bacterium]